MKSSIDKNKVFVTENVAGKAQARHRGPSLTDQRLASRRFAFDRLPADAKAEMHNPGSQNRHKV
jgi:hypothetical protein